MQATQMVQLTSLSCEQATDNWNEEKFLQKETSVLMVSNT